MAEHDAFDQIIIKLAGGHPERLRIYRTEYTHTEIITAWKGKLVNG